MASFNKVLLMGHLTRDPQLSYTPNQTAVADFGIAMNRSWVGQDGNKRDEVCFVDLRSWGKTAENINRFFKKGKPIFIEGYLQLDQWTTQDGTKKTKLRVIVERFHFLPGGGNNGNGNSGDGDSGGYQDQPGGYGGGTIPDSDPDSDIPF